MKDEKSNFFSPHKVKNADRGRHIKQRKHDMSMFWKEERSEEWKGGDCWGKLNKGSESFSQDHVELIKLTFLRYRKLLGFLRGFPFMLLILVSISGSTSSKLIINLDDKKHNVKCHNSKYAAILFWFFANLLRSWIHVEHHHIFWCMVTAALRQRELLMIFLSRSSMFI